ncbi:hypothetical protein SOVF_128980 [Spinacia oleracea]|uniref:Uncharacterized protein LOC110802923 n=1 Tax=Spinacia oleracea TaxID=3562 RepID=A0A9R0JA72_SPIOL|nr:uncharacterized protein LOC110802923 [Spinacia oleracea]XP_021864066.1 uncharacterized protein LOC110802923 [Spinacia oleracea]KNA12102.1 hypothetical protein SOVF_128980 [Spinacia oleracea]
MTSIATTHSSIWSSGTQQCFTGRFSEGRREGYTGSVVPYKSSFCPSRDLVYTNNCHRASKHHAVCSSSVNKNDAIEPEDENSDMESSKSEGQQASSDSVRDNLERIVGVDDSTFSGADLAAVIRNKYGRSYDVQLIKKEFMGKNFLAMNVMWKYREQRSFPLTEEEYILRLDDVATNLRCWGAVSHIRSSLAKSKERPRIGKAVSIFIDMDESGARSNEWIYK